MKPVLDKTLMIFLFFSLAIVEYCVCIGICRESEQQALEILKKETYDPNNSLSSWIIGKDCCEWEGVVCHNLTRHVSELYMSSWDGYGNYTYLRIDNLEWLPSLLNLKNLKMMGVDLSKATNWLQITNMLPSLVELSLHMCRLHHIPPLLDHSNFSSLETLVLSENNFSSPIPKWIFSLSTLVSLELSFSTFTGPFREGPINLTSLKNFGASGNSFNCPLPRWLFDLHNLETIYLMSCGIEGVIPSKIGNITKLKGLYLSGNELNGTLPRSLGCLSMLESLWLSGNKMKGTVTESHFTGLTQLMHLFAGGNGFTLKVSKNWIPPFKAKSIMINGWNIGPQFPMWLQTQQMIWNLDMSYGGIKGEVPTWFWNLCPQMQMLYLSHNQLIGEVPKISSFSRSVIYLDSNNFSGPIPWVSSSVITLDLSNNFFSGGLSHLLCSIENKPYNLEILNLGNNDLSGEIPNCWMNWSKLTVLILGDNNLIGGIPQSIEFLSNLKSLDFRRNSLTGPLPSSLGNCTKLLKIDLAENDIIGELPPWLGRRLSQLIILILRSNKLHGELPKEICNLKDLQILDIANNSFIGIIPRCIDNFTTMVTGGKGRVVDNALQYYSFGVSVTESAMVTTKGNTYMYDNILRLVTSMDMSSNNLSGDIPTSLTNLVGLRSCNFSKNHLTGRIPDDIGDVKVLESFDLSENQLTGQIPQSLASLSFLSYLNMSNNNLSGKIPLSTQLQSFNSSSFEGNKNLCGPPLLKNCNSDDQTPNLDENEEEERDEDEWDGFYISMAIGFVLCFCGVGGSLILKKS